MLGGPRIRSSTVRPLRESDAVRWLFREQDAQRAIEDDARLQTETRYKARAKTSLDVERDAKRADYEQSRVDSVRTIGLFRARSATR